MRILQILHSYPPQSFGGTELYTQSLAEVLAQKHQVKIIYARDDRSKQEQTTLGIGSCDNISVSSVERVKPAFFKESYLNPGADEKVLCIISDFSPDVVHIEHLLNHSISLIDKMSALSIPMVLTLHDYWYICPQCHLTRSDGTICEGPGGGRRCLSCADADGNRYIPLANAVSSHPLAVAGIETVKACVPEPLRKWTRRFFHRKTKEGVLPPMGFVETTGRLQHMIRTLNLVDLIISPSKLLAERYRGEGITNIIVLPHGIRAISASERSIDKYKNIANRKIRFAFLGSLAEHKGIHVLVEAFKRTDPAKAELLIFGKAGPDRSYSNRLHQAVRHPGIKFMGFVDHKMIYETLKLVDVVVIPSICSENYPLIANEAFLARTPLIASKVGGLNELITHGVSGYLFQPGSADELYELISSVIVDPKILEKMSSNIPHVRTMVEHAQEIESLYQKVITARASSR